MVNWGTSPLCLVVVETDTGYSYDCTLSHNFYILLLYDPTAPRHTAHLKEAEQKSQIDDYFGCVIVCILCYKF